VEWNAARSEKPDSGVVGRALVRVLELVLIQRLAAILIAGGIATANAQFFGLATPADGSRVYFASPLRERGSTQATWGKLFEIERPCFPLNGPRNHPAGLCELKLAEAREYGIPNPPPPGVGIGLGMAQPSDAYGILGAAISADGSVMAVTGRRDCVAGDNYCYKIENYLTTIAAGGKSAEYPGYLQLSANGHWAFGGSSHTSHDDFLYFAYLVDLQTGALTTVSEMLGSWINVTTSGRPVASDGTAVFSLDSGLVILRGGQMQRIAGPSGGGTAGAVIDAAGRTVVYAVCTTFACLNPGPRSLHVADVVTGNSRPLAPEGDAPSLSDDGKVVLYISTVGATPQLRIIGSDGTGDRPLTNDPSGIARAVLSGDGTTAYAVTLGGRLLKITTVSGAVSVLLDRTPIYGTAAVPAGTISGPLIFAPGKVTTISGAGFTDTPLTAAPPLPYKLGKVSVTIGGEPVRIVSVAPSAVTVEAPPDLAVPGGPNPAMQVSILVPSESPFLPPPSADAQVVAFYPEFLFAAGNTQFVILSAHQDWSSLVSANSPAVPGEVLHSYGVGFGPTAPVVPYGGAAPSEEPLARLTSPLTCKDLAAPVEVFFAGAAPGLVGMYQVDWRVPTDARSGQSRCKEYKCGKRHEYRVITPPAGLLELDCYPLKIDVRGYVPVARPGLTQP
jgi:uncharacterized protein (TIGR03437 family)